MSQETPTVRFPCDYPIKVMIRAGPGVREKVDEIIERHAGPVDRATVSERPSAQNRFLGITYLIHAQSEAQIAALFQALKICPEVMLVL